MGLRASIFKHPIHPMLIPFPIGLFIFSLFSDLVYRGTGNLAWSSTAFYTMAAGIVMALLAAIPGFIDYLTIHKQPSKSTATFHMVINLLVVLLYVLNLGLRWSGTNMTLLPLILSIAGVVLLGISGWLGGELVYVQGVSVEPQEAIAPARVEPTYSKPETRRTTKTREEELEEAHK